MCSGSAETPSPHPRPCCCRWKQLTASPVTKEQSALIKAHLRTAQGWLENPSMLLTPDEEGLSPWALSLQHLPQRRARQVVQDFIPRACVLASFTTAGCLRGSNGTESQMWFSPLSPPHVRSKIDPHPQSRAEAKLNLLCGQETHSTHTEPQYPCLFTGHN